MGAWLLWIVDLPAEGGIRAGLLHHPHLFRTQQKHVVVADNNNRQAPIKQQLISDIDTISAGS